MIWQMTKTTGTHRPTSRRRSRHGPLPWGPPASEAHPGGREPLTRDQIVDAAMRLANTDGLEGLSMRRLGQELGAGATSVYWHIKNKDQLEDLMVDRLIGEVMAELRETNGWRDGLAEVARVMRRVLIRHRNIAPLLGERPTVGPSALDAAERVMGILRDGGFDTRTTSMASGALINYASGFALFESRASGSGTDPEQAAADAEAVMEYFRSLPEDRYPNLLAVAGISITEDEQFEYGLQRLLDGFAADRAAGSSRPGGDANPGAPGTNMLLVR